MILYCAADLLWATKIKSTADSLAIPCRPARNADMLAARLADSPVKALIVDLEAGQVALDLIRLARSTPRPGNPMAIIAFGPHVAVEALAAARSAGADAVLARGAFNRTLPQILTQLSGGAAVESVMHD